MCRRNLPMPNIKIKVPGSRDEIFDSPVDTLNGKMLNCMAKITSRKIVVLLTTKCYKTYLYMLLIV